MTHQSEPGIFSVRGARMERQGTIEILSEPPAEESRGVIGAPIRSSEFLVHAHVVLDETNESKVLVTATPDLDLPPNK